MHIPFRPLKDPREIRLLDPACGSMHFGLYAFDLFEVIYDEAWEIAHGSDEARKSSASFAPFVSFVVQYPDKAAFLAEVPRLIIEHNIHGIDIDPRAVADRRALPLAARPARLAAAGAAPAGPAPHPPLEHRLRRAHARREGVPGRIHRAAVPATPERRLLACSSAAFSTP